MAARVQLGDITGRSTNVQQDGRAEVKLSLEPPRVSELPQLPTKHTAADVTVADLPRAATSREEAPPSQAMDVDTASEIAAPPSEPNNAASVLAAELPGVVSSASARAGAAELPRTAAPSEEAMDVEAAAVFVVAVAEPIAAAGVLSVDLPKRHPLEQIAAAGAELRQAAAPPEEALPSQAMDVDTADVTPSGALLTVDIQAVPEYAASIDVTLKQAENEYMTVPSYMQRQADVTARMRAILLDWLVEVHMKYKMRPETLFLCRSIIDRYLERMEVKRRCLQLVGVAALSLAAKFEEIMPPETKDYVYITDRAYTKEEVHAMEADILNTLDFRLCSPTPMHFLLTDLQVNGSGEAHGHFVQYLLELTLVDMNMTKYPPSHLAAAACFASNKLLHRSPSWPPAMRERTGFDQSALRECARNMVTLLDHSPQSQYKAVFKKFSKREWGAVATTWPVEARGHPNAASSSAPPAQQQPSPQRPQQASHAAARSAEDAARSALLERCGLLEQQQHSRDVVVAAEIGFRAYHGRSPRAGEIEASSAGVAGWAAYSRSSAEA